MSIFPTQLPDPQFTLGVVIPVPEPQRSVLRQWRREFGGVATEAIAPHITLVSGGYQESWEQAAAQVRRAAQHSARFRVQLGAARSFAPASQVVYLPLVAGAERCLELHQLLLEQQLVHQSQFDYHPHLTIAQNLSDQLLDAAQQRLAEAELGFEADRVQLFDTRDGAWNLSEEISLGR